jgi:DNA-binding CsgD family transcriptional regulator
VETVRTHVKSICQKMHARNRLEAVARHHANLE